MNLTIGHEIVENLNGKQIFRDEALALPLSIPFGDIALHLDWLKTIYPVSCHAVGKRLFNALALQFISEFAEVCRSPDDLIRKFADFVESLTSADTLFQFKSLIRLEYAIESLPMPKNNLNSSGSLLKLWTIPASDFKVILSKSAILLQTRQNEVSHWLKQQSHYAALQQVPNHIFYQVDSTGGKQNHQDEVVNVTPLKVDEYWVIRKSSDGIAVTPICQQRFEFYSFLQGGMSLASVKQHCSLRTISRWLMPALHHGLFELTSGQ